MKAISLICDCFDEPGLAVSVDMGCGLCVQIKLSGLLVCTMSGYKTRGVPVTSGGQRQATVGHVKVPNDIYYLRMINSAAPSTTRLRRNI
jgi:hypothetical protein